MEAAELLVESAHLRPEAHFPAARNLQFAASVFAWSGDRQKARELFEEAARTARELAESREVCWRDREVLMARLALLDAPTRLGDIM